MFGDFFKPSNDIKKIQKNVIEHKHKVTELITEIKLGQSFQENYMNVLLELCEYMNLYVWRKDENFLYEFANIYYCVNFLGLTPDQANEIKGLSDSKAHNRFNPKITADEEKFWIQACSMTDKEVKKVKKTCNFIEGDINNKILNVKKIPNLKNDEFKGTIGIAQDIDKKIIIPYLKKMIKKNNVKHIYGDIDDKFCYQIIENKDSSLFSFVVEEK